jgi:nucleotide-binding universal stress UspA family protein
MSRIIGRVVVGVSGSAESLHALRHGVELARQYEATLIAVNAQPAAPAGRFRPRGAPAAEPWQHTACTVVRTAFDEALGGLPRGLDCVLLAAPGRPGPALLAVAERANDVLVLGARRGPGVSRLIRRGVAAYCVEHASCSVLRIPPPPLVVRQRTLARAPHNS